MGSSPSAPSEWFTAAVQQNLPKLKRLLAQNPDYVNAQDKERLQTALHVACRGGYYNVVQFLIMNGATTNVRDELSATPIDHARDKSHNHIVELLEQWDNGQRTSWSLANKPAADWLRKYNLEPLVCQLKMCQTASQIL